MCTEGSQCVFKAMYVQRVACFYQFFEYTAQFKELMWSLSALKKVFERKVDVLGLLTGNATFCLRNDNAEETNWCFASD